MKDLNVVRCRRYLVESALGLHQAIEVASNDSADRHFRRAERAAARARQELREVSKFPRASRKCLLALQAIDEAISAFEVRATENRLKQYLSRVDRRMQSVKELCS